ncbi:hypothetical protein [Glutamicibacter sp. MCAF14]|uniref:hypothetical protein n=1 Tax=Glutamicibacter sp. MCAF14 TaxID=3233043 RepID=UPI003F90322C
MIDKKKLIIFGALAAVIVAAIIGGIVWAANNSEPAAEPTTAPTANEPSQSATPTPSITPSPSDGKFDGLMSFDKDREQAASNAAVAAAKWSSPVSDEARQQGYLSAEFSPELAKSFAPVWADIYDPEQVTSLTVEANAERVWLNDATGEESKHTYRVGVLVNYNVDWMLRSGGASGQPEAQATWWVTMDEKSGKVTKIDQPTKSELNIDLSK